MKLPEAYRILNDLQQRIDYKKPIMRQLGDLFTIPFWGETPVLKESWQGRIASVFNSPPSKLTDKKIFAICYRALALVSADRERAKGIPADLTVSFRREAGKNYQFFNDTELDARIASSPELLELTEQQESKRKAAKTKPEKPATLSPFSEPLQKDAAPVNLNTLKAIFDDIDEDNPKAALRFLEGFLKKNPSYGVVDWEKSLSQIRKAINEDKQLTKAFQDSGNAWKSTLKVAAAQLTKELHSLDHKAKEKKLVLLSYGPKIFSLREMRDIASHLPTQALNKLPKPLKDFLSSNSKKEIDQVADDLIRECFNNIKTLFPNIAGQINPTSVKPFLPDSERQIPEAVAAWLPKIIENYLECTLQNGIANAAAGLVPDPNLSNALAWFSKHGDLLLAEDKNSLAKIFEEKLLHLLHDKLSSINQEFNLNLSSLFKKSQHLVSPLFLELIGVDRLTVSGPLWLEFEKAHEGLFNLSVYTLGSGLSYHMVDPNSGKPYTLLRLGNISASEINDEFILNMLKRHLEPYKNPEAASQAADIYNGPFATLKANVIVNKLDDPIVSHNRPATHWGMCQTLLLKKPEEALFELRWQALLNYVKPLYKNQCVQIPDQESCELLSQAVQKLKTEITCIIKDNKDNQRFEKIQAALSEVEKGIDSFSSKHTARSKVEEAEYEFKINIKEQFQGIFKNAGLPLEKLREYRGVVAWLLGEDISELIDQIDNFNEAIQTESKTVSTPKTTSKPENLTQPQGVLVHFYYEMYLQLIRRVFEIAALAAGCFHGGLWHVLDVPFILSQFPNLLPQALQDWYARIKSVIMRKLAEFCVATLIVRFVDEKSRMQLQQMAQDWKSSIQKQAQVLIEGKPVTFNIQAPIPFDNKNIQTPDEPAISGTTPPQNPAPPPVNNFNSLIYRECDWKDRSLIINDEFTLIDEIEKCLNYETSSIFFNHYITRVIERLPIPSPHNQTIWDELPDPLNYLEFFLQLNIKYLNKTDDDSGKLYVSYKILAITDYLARRCPDANLKGYRINAYPLLQYYITDPHRLHNHYGVQAINHTNLIVDPFRVTELERLISYFLPEIDLKNPPDEKEIEKLQKDTLFYYGSSDLSKAEKNYYKHVVKQPGFKESLKINNLDYNLLKNSEIDDIIHRESFVTSRTNPIIPPAYAYLHLQTNICTLLVKRRAVPKYDSLLRKGPDYSIKTKRATLWLGFDNTATIKLPWNSHEFNGLDLSLLRIDDNFFPDTSNITSLPALQTEGRRLEYGWAFKYFFAQQAFPPPLVIEFEKIFSTPTEQIPRLLSFLKKYAGQLPEYYDPLISWRTYPSLYYLLGIVLFKPGALHQLIKSSTQSILAIGEVLNAQIDHYLTKNKHKLALSVAEIMIGVRNYCFSISPESVEGFPDIRAKLDLIADSTDDQNCKNWNLLLKVMLWPSSLKEMSLEDQNQAIADFCITLQTIDEDSVRFINGHILNQFKHRAVEWKSDVQHILQNPIRLFQITCIIYKQQQIMTHPIELTHQNKPLDDLSPLNLFKDLASYQKLIHSKTIDPTPQPAAPRLPPVENEIPHETVKKCFAGIERFCQLDKIHAKAFQGESHISSFELQDLNFKVVNKDNGVLIAECKQYPGFHLAEKQTDPSLEGISSYLILEEKSGKKLALVNKGQWLQAAAFRIGSIAGPFSRIIMDALAKIDFYSISSGYYAYQIETTGLLNSSDPQALVYLLNLYFFQGNLEKLEKTLLRFEWICNITPLPSSAWLEVIPLLVAQVDIPGIAHLRRQIMAAMAQNQLIVDSEEKKPNVYINLISALGIFIILEDYLQKKNKREALSLHQEYFLYRCAFEKLSDLVNKDTKLAFESIGLETLIAITGVAPHLAKRYKKIRSKAGFDTSLPATLTHLLAECTLSSKSSIPNVLIEAKNSSQTVTQRMPHERTGLLDKGIHCFARSRQFLKNNINDLDLTTLFAEMDADFGTSQPPMTPSEITSEIITKRFYAYYCIAKASGHDAKRLLDALKMVKGMGDKRARILMDYLIGVASKPEAYPSAFEFSEARKPSLNIAPNSSVNPISYLNWFDFFDKLNNLTYGLDVADQLIDPILKQQMIRQGAYHLTGRVVSSIMPTSSSTLVQQGIDVISRSTYDAAGEKLAQAAQPLKNLIPSTRGISAYIASRPIQETVNEIFDKTADVLIPVGLFLGLSYSLSYMVRKAADPTAPPEPEEIKEQQTYLSYIAYQALTHVGSAFVRFTFAKLLKKQFTLNDAFGPFVSANLHKASSIMNTVRDKSLDWLAKKQRELIQSLGEPLQNPEIKHITDLSPLLELDKAFDEFFDSQFDLAFVEGPPEPIPETILKLPKTSSNPILDDKYKKVHDSINAYRTSHDHPSTFKLFNVGIISQIHLNLLQFKSNLLKTLEKDNQNLLDLFNQTDDPEKPNPTPLTLKQIQAIINSDKIEKLGKPAGLTAEKIPQLELAAARIDLKTSRLHQVERLISLIEKIDPSSPSYIETLEKLAIEFRARTAFGFKDASSRMIRKFLRFQAAAKTMLWKKQVQNRINALEGKYQNVVCEQIPGSGKTFFSGPFTAEYLADGSNLAVTVFPKQLAGDNQREIHEQMWNIFGKRSHVLQSRREMRISISKLESIIFLLIGSIKAKEPLHMTKEDAQAFQSVFFDRINRYRHVYGANTWEEKQCLILYKKILAIFRTLGIDITDEYHEALNYRKQLIYPLGTPLKIPLNLYMIQEAVMRVISRDPDLYALIRKNKLNTLSKHTYRDVIKPRLAEAMSRYWKFKIDDDNKRREFIAYVCDQATSIPSWISSDATLFREIALVKGILNNLFTMNLKKRAQVDYASSKKGNGDFARPSDGNSHVLESDSIKLPFETVLKTYLMLQTSGLSKDQTVKLVNKLKAMAELLIIKTGIKYENTLLFKCFGKLIPNLKDPIPEKKLLKLSRKREAVLLYMRHFVWKQILFWTKNIQNTSQDFAGIFNKHQSYTGTPHNDGTYPSDVTLMPDPTTLGESLHIISTKCAGFHTLHSRRPTEILKEILKRFFALGSPFSSFLDGGAYCEGIENKEVARIMAAYCEECRPDIKEILYYHEDEQGKEGVHKIRIGTNDNKEIEPHQRLTYYDQRHCFGANIFQWGIGVATIGPDDALFNEIQLAFRDRAIKNIQRLMEIEDTKIVMPVKTIHYVFTEEIRKMILERDPMNPPKDPLKVPDISDATDFGIRNEAARAKENKPSMYQKYSAAARQRAYDKMILDYDYDNFDGFFEGWMDIYDEFENQFITTQNFDTAHLFGPLKHKGNTADLMHKAAVRSANIIGKSSEFTSEEKKKFKEHIESIPLPPLPKTTTYYGNGDADILMDLGLEQTMEMTAEQNTMQTEENDNELQNELQNHMQNQFRNLSDYSPYKETSWPKNTSPYHLNWLKCVQPQKITSLFKIKNCLFYTVNDLMRLSENKYLAEVAHMFDKRLWMSNNFVHCMFDYVSETAAEIGSIQQLDLADVLVHLKDNGGKIEILKVAPLSAKESSDWRNRLEKYDGKASEIKTVVWSVYTGNILAGYMIDKEILRNDQDFKTLLCQLKFLNGDVKYKGDYDEMAAWIKAHDPGALNDAFDAIHAERGVEPSVCQDIDHIFIQTRDLPYEERL